ncbi:MAG: S41 family peptidase [Muribaculaceae bacterium]|nr:S41 family peptidase [Muribaculaceae bacterium]
MKRFFTILLVLAAIAGAIGAKSADEARKDRFARKLHTFNAIVKELHTNYVDTLDATAIMDKTIDALLYQIDPYTEYYPADNQDEILSISQGKYAGIGSIISKRGDTTYINEPSWDSPARKGGLRAGDAILAIDGVDMVGAKVDVGDVSKRLRGQAGTEVRVDVRRPYSPDSVMSFTITRAEIKVDPLPYYELGDDGIGYIRLTTFNESSSRKVREALQDILARPGVKGIVIDLRSNGGGLLESAVQIASNFVPKGTEILRTRGRDARDERIYKTVGQPLDTKVPLAILIDGGTASASEILSGSMQDLDRAVVVGERSYGKGLVQTTRPLPYDDILKITTGRYYIPSGRLIQVLDYSHRNPDGSPARVPDSLTHEFSTRAGRIVRDGGGITPDVTIKQPELNRLIYNIVADNWAYNYATRHVALKPEPGPSDSFVVGDSIFAEFKAFIDPDKFKYDRQCETGLKYLREAAEAEGYMTDSVAAQFEILGAMLRHDLSHDLDINRDEIVRILDDELASRYYSDADRVRRSIRDDSTLTEARKILLDPDRYSTLLSPAKAGK